MRISNYVIQNALDIDYYFLEENNFDDKAKFYQQNFYMYYQNQQDTQNSSFSIEHEESLQMFSEQEFKIEYNNFESEPLIKEIGKDEIIELFILEEKQKRNNLRKCSRLTQTEIENESLVFRKFQSDFKMIKYGLSENEYRKLC